MSCHKVIGLLYIFVCTVIATVATNIFVFVFSSACTLTVQQQYTLAAVVHLVAPFWSSRFLRVTGRLAWTLLIYGLQIGTMVELKIKQTHILKKKSNQGAQQLISVL